MWKLVGMLALALVFPAVWGLFAHWITLRLWPVERRRTAPWLAATAPQPTAQFLDYQI